MASHREEKLDTTFHKKQFYVEMEPHSKSLPLLLRVLGPEYMHCLRVCSSSEETDEFSGKCRQRRLKTKQKKQIN